MDGDGKKLSDLRVVDLKLELEKRSLDICGIKSTLQERLKNALVEDGLDPESFLFGGGAPSPTKKDQEGSVVPEAKESTEQLTESDMQDLVVKDDIDEAGAEESAEIQGIQMAGGDHHQDNEDSLNLTIGEDEANLLQGEENEEKDAVKPANESVPENASGKENQTAEHAEKTLTEPEKSAKATAEGDDEKKAPSTTKNGDAAGPDDKESSLKSASTNKNAGTAEGAQKAAAPPASATAASPGSTTGESAKGSAGRNLWVSGLSSTTRATDLKQLFSKYGKVVGAKVVTNTKMAGSRCYGYVTMNAAEDALKCVEHLHRTELHGRMISVEKAKSELSAPKATGSTNGSSGTASTPAQNKPTAAKSTAGESPKKPYTSAAKKKEAPKPPGRVERPPYSTSRPSDPSRDNSNNRAKDATTRRGDRRSPVRAKPTTAPPRDDAARALAAKERELQRERERDRIARQREREQFEADRLRHEREKARLKEKLEEEEKKTREVRRRAREEEEKLARERKKIQLERVRLEREKAELLRLERQKLERERLELERQEIKRQQMKVEEAKRNLKRPLDDRDRDRDRDSGSSRYVDGERDRKRTNTDRGFGAPPPPRFESAIRMSSSNSAPVDKKRDDFPVKHRDNNSSSYGSSSRSRDDSRSSKRDDYDSPKRDRRESNLDYKRDSGYSKRSDIDMPPRHSSSSGGGGGGSYSMGGSHSRALDNTEMVIMKPYIDQGRGGSSNEFRRTIQSSSMNNVTLIGGNPSNGGGSGMSPMVLKDDRPRYIDTGSQNEMRYGGGGNDRGGMWQNSAGPLPVKPFGTVQIQNDDWSQDRYDRTYNERKSPYMEPARQSSGSGQSSFMNRPQDRYNSRFDNGRF